MGGWDGWVGIGIGIGVGGPISVGWKEILCVRLFLSLIIAYFKIVLVGSTEPVDCKFGDWSAWGMCAKLHACFASYPS